MAKYKFLKFSKDNLILVLDGQTAYVVLCRIEDVQLNGLKISERGGQ